MCVISRNKIKLNNMNNRTLQCIQNDFPTLYKAKQNEKLNPNQIMYKKYYQITHSPHYTKQSKMKS